VAPTAAENSAAAPDAAPRGPLTLREATVLSLAWGYAALVTLGCLAVLLGWTGLVDTLDVRRFFR
jgi:hypothetical protein